MVNTKTSRARAMLRNMPDEVFRIYLEPLIRSNGWPFRGVDSPTFGVWRNYFDGHTLKKISQLTWKREKISFRFARFHPSSKDRIRWIIGAHIYGLNTPCANVVNGRARFIRCQRYIASTARMPVPVILMRSYAGLRILDGNHRLAAMASLPNSSIGVIDCWIGE